AADLPRPRRPRARAGYFEPCHPPAGTRARGQTRVAIRLEKGRHTQARSTMAKHMPAADSLSRTRLRETTTSAQTRQCPSRETDGLNFPLASWSRIIAKRC